MINPNSELSYNTQYKCNYNSPDIFKNVIIENIEMDEEYNMREMLYRQDLLYVFQLEEFDDEKINKIIHEIYGKIKDNSHLDTILVKMAGLFFSEDKEVGLMALFSFDYFYIFHPCLCDILKNGEVSNENLTKLIEHANNVC
jgi:hypothetical protein